MGRFLALLALACVAGAILYFATTGGFPDSYWAVRGFFHEQLGLSTTTAERWTDVVRKSFHIPAYALLAMLVWWVLPRGRRRWWWVLVIVLLVGTVDELVQSQQPSRTARVTDVLVDLAGALLGLWIAGAWRRSVAERETPPAPPSPT